MWVRRAFYYAQFWAIPVLPLWLLIGRGLVANGVGWEFVVLLFACPVLALAMIIVMGLVMARKTVRRARMLSWADLGVLGAWYLAIIVAGFVANPVTAVLVVVLTVAAFWVAVWQLFVETRRRVNTVFASFDAVQITPR
jgi:hypothetical protein